MPQKPIRILHALGALDAGGVETWLLNVLRHIDRDKFHFAFCTFADHEGIHAPETERMGAAVLRCPMKENRLTFGRRFRRILHKGRYDAVHSHVHFFSGAVLRWAHRESVPVRIAHSHNSQDDKRGTLLRHHYLKIMRSWIEAYATHGLAASELAAAGLFGQNWQADRRLRVLHYGIDMRDFDKPVDREKIRAQLGIPPGAIVIGHVGRFVAVKNHGFLLQIGKQLLRTHPETHFLLVGDGPLRHQIEASARAMGLNRNFHFAGVRTDVPELMCGAMDLFALPSICEGFGLVLLEAQAAGLSCVVSDSVPRETAISTSSVRFANLGSGPAHWAQLVADTLGQSGPETRARLRGTLAGLFSIQRSVEELERIYVATQPQTRIV